MVGTDIDIAKILLRAFPREMLCADDFARGSYVRAKREALRSRYVQWHHANVAQALVLDLDYAVDAGMFRYVDAPAPNILVFNPENGHAHAWYLLDGFVPLGGRCPGKEAEYNAVYCALRDELCADPGYARKLTKNPFHPQWRAVVLDPDPYQLSELRKRLGVRAAQVRAPKRKPAEDSPVAAFGRNCEVFERLRHRAYAAVNAMGEREFIDFCRRAADELNAEFRRGLPCREVAGIVKSVSAWTLEHMAGRAARGAPMDVWGDEARAESARVRRERKDELAMRARAMRMEGASVGAIAEALGRSRRMVEYYLAHASELVEEANIRFAVLRAAAQALAEAPLGIALMAVDSAICILQHYTHGNAQYVQSGSVPLSRSPP